MPGLHLWRRNLETGMKTCGRCLQEKPLLEFSLQHERRDGRGSYCKQCRVDWFKQYYQDHPDRVKAAVRRSRDKHPDRVRAYERVRWAKESGRLQNPGKCDRCGGDFMVEAHHHRGYEGDHALDVLWLCRPCHSLERVVNPR